MSSDSQNWRGIDVMREKKHDALVTLLTNGSDSIFTFIKDLMVFGATIGFSLNKRIPLAGDLQGIILDTYSSDGKDGYIYLYGLLAQKDGECLKHENLHSTVKIYEEFCNAGLYEIQKWLDENPGDPYGTETILNKIYERISSLESSDDIDPGDIDLDI